MLLKKSIKITMDTENITSDANTSAAPTQHLVCSMIPTPAGNGSPNNTLNNDCVVEIFKRMQTNDLIIISFYCDHCLDLIKSHIFPYRQINIDDVFKVYNIRKVFAKLGSDIGDLIIHRRHIQDKSQELLEMLTLNCIDNSLKKLDISLNFHDIDASCIESFADKLQNVHNLTITASHYRSGQRKVNTSENNKKMEILLRNVVRLKTIHINMMPICGGFLHRTPIKHLMELALVQCEQIQVDALVESGAHFKCLTNFVWINSKFDGIQSVSDNISTVCDILGREFETVQAVTVHMNYDLKYCKSNDERRSILSGLKQLPHLKSLSIGVAGACACNNFYDVIQQLEQLKSFAIESPLTFGGRNRLRCEKVISNYLPKIFDKLRNLTNLRIVCVNPQRTEHLFNEIMDKLKNIDELHLIGIRQFNAENLLSLVQNIPKLKIISLNDTTFNFTEELYNNLMNECQNRHLKIIVSQSVRRTILTRVAKYCKEFVQIAAD